MRNSKSIRISIFVVSFAVAATIVMLLVGGGDANESGVAKDTQAQATASHTLAIPTSTTTPRQNAFPTPQRPFTASWIEPAQGQVLSDNTVRLRIAYGPGTDKRRVDRIDFTIHQGPRIHLCSTGSTSGRPMEMPGAPFPAVYFYECDADLTDLPNGTIQLGSNVRYEDGSIQSNVAGTRTFRKESK